MRKVTVMVKVQMTINMDEGLEVGQVIEEMDYHFTAQNDGAATIEDTEIKDYDVLYSK